MYDPNRPDPTQLADKPYTVKTGQYFSRGWELFQKNIGGFVGFLLLCIVVFAIAGGINPRLAQLLNFIVGGPLNAGFLIVAFKLAKGKQTTFSDFLLGFNNFLQFFLLSAIAGLLIGLGTVLLVLPGIYLAVSYIFAAALIVDRRFFCWDAMETSRKLVSKQWFSFFILGVALVGVNIVGALLLGVGLLATIPLTVCTIAAAYEDIVGFGADEATF